TRKSGSFIVDELVETQEAVIWNTGDEGFDGTGLTGFTAMCNATTTHTLKPNQVTTGMTTSTVGPDVAKNNGTGLNLNDPSTSTTGLNSITSVNTGPVFNVVNM
ncbi:hypothetical protein Tco_0426653, partial [Tanacetum coccineum]